MYWQIVIHRVSDMSLFDSRHDTQCHAVEVVMSRHVKTHHQITSYHHIISHHIPLRNRIECNRTEQSRMQHRIISYHIYRILIHADTATATDTQTVISLTYQPEIPQDITSHHIKDYRNIELQSQSQCSYSTVTRQYSTRQNNTITGQSRAALLSTVRYCHRTDDMQLLLKLLWLCL